MDSEDGFLSALRALALDPAARGLTDDAAVINTAPGALVLTHDTMIEGVHWLVGQNPADVAWKLVAVNLSDLAAKGCKPVGIMLSYMLGTAEWNASFVTGLGEALTAFDVPLLGGDTVAAKGMDAPLVLGITALGEPLRRPVPARKDACVGEAVWVTGTIGAALAGFEALQSGSKDCGESIAYRRPTPRLAEGRALAKWVGAMMDVSDGLMLDASRMADASDVTIAIETGAVPITPALARRRREAMSWGDDYELLFTLPEGSTPPVEATRIGKVQPRGGHPLLLDGSPPLSGSALGFRHNARVPGK
ncbi:thiamine-phosphate kinase [Croceicoccus mobilis]|uniref:Thiamine-monophosphate kinase n=1 Tax=Croceicoccus mobilis TaxID=1703339 RepID=A0A916Z5C8_9SPHN|nr:thiamine-phosphate kinase [Croceicoccus mobilis]GGD77445.1 thiamine-monophosphate kinase [Croceicoccus mobilis]